MNALANQHTHTYSPLLTFMSGASCKSRISKPTKKGKRNNAFVSFEALPGATVVHYARLTGTDTARETLIVKQR